MKTTPFSPTDRQLDVLAQLWRQNVPVRTMASQFGTTAYSINYLCRLRRDLFPKRGSTDAMVVESRECVRCGAEYSSKWARRKYCEPCSFEVLKEQGGNDIEARSRTRNAAIEEIQSTKGKQKTRLTDVFERPDLAWSVTFSIPYSNNASKNRRWRVNEGGAVYMTEQVRKFDKFVQLQTKHAMRDAKLVQNKVWLSFLVEKPDHKSDAINIIDTLCDAIKKAIAIDDRWFSIKQLDWCIKKNEPHIIISIGQEATFDVIACSHCGEMKPIDCFNKNRSGPFGRCRACIECQRVINRAAQKEKRRSSLAA